MSAPLLEVEDLVVDLPVAEGTVRAVRGVSWRLHEREVLGMVGESGSGKSMSALAVMGLLPTSARASGSVRLQGQELLGAPAGVLQGLRNRRIAMVLQDPLSSLNPVYDVGWQLAEAVRAHSDVSRRAARARAVELLRLVGLPRPEGQVDAYPHQLSGGMRQRVVIAMAIAHDPEVLIADEPTSALDATVQAQVLEVLQVAREATGAAMLLITHDLGVVAGVADRVLVMYAGRVLEDAPVDGLFHATRSPYTKGLLACVPRLDDERPLVPIPGAPPSLLALPAGCAFAPRCPLQVERCSTDEPVLDRHAHAVACHVTGVA